MRILILLIYNESETEAYNKMLTIQRQYIHSHAHIDSYFVTFRSQTNPIEIEDDIIYVRGRESILNILHKTLESMEYLSEQKSYDYVIRSNISTIFKLTQLYTIIHKSQHRVGVYQGCTRFKLNGYRDSNAGLTDKNFASYNIEKCAFYQGTCIILSKDVVSYILKHKNKMLHDVVDDVAIGLFLRSYMHDVYTKGVQKKRIRLILSENEYGTGAVIRNKTECRKTDAENMEKYVSRYLFDSISYFF